jgi:hypothetical protein
MLAAEDPALTREIATATLGRPVEYAELYGDGTPDPTALSRRERRIRFATECSGHGFDRELQAGSVPRHPRGPLNTERALFMSHPINGLDDLLYIVMFGGQAFAVEEDGSVRQTTKEAIFRAGEVEHLACRNADPAAAMAAYEQVWRGNRIAFADPLGVYITSFTADALSWNGAPVPAEWIRVSRGAGDPTRPLTEGFFQRLEFGPPDEVDVFLDDILINEAEPLTGGYDLARRTEVGPKLRVGPTTPPGAADWQIIPAAEDLINCSEASVCGGVIIPLKQAFDQAHGGGPGPRGPG